MTYPDKSLVIETLLDAARKAALDVDVEHPEDIAVLMSSAIEYSWPVIIKLHNDGRLK